MCNSVALDIRFRPSSCRQCHGYGPTGKKLRKRAPPSGRWRFGSPVRRLRGVLRVLLPWSLPHVTHHPPPQKKRPLGDPTIARPRSSMPPQGWSCWSRWWHTRTWRTYNLLSIARLHFIVRICQEKTSEMETSRPHCRSRAGWWWPIKTGLTSLSFKFTSSKYLKIMSFRDNKTHKFPTSLAAAVLPTAAAGAGLRWQQKKTTQHFPDKNHIKNRKKNRKTQQDSRNSPHLDFVFWAPTSKHRHLGLGWHFWLDASGVFRDPGSQTTVSGAGTTQRPEIQIFGRKGEEVPYLSTSADYALRLLRFKHLPIQFWKDYLRRWSEAS